MTYRKSNSFKARLLSAVVCAAMVLCSVHHGLAQAQDSGQAAQDAKRIEKVRNDVRKIRLGGGITVSRLDNRDFFGDVRRIGEEDFEVTDADSGMVHIFKYADVKNVRPGSGSINRTTGERSNSKARKVLGWVAAAVLGAILVVTLVQISDDGT